MGSFAGTNLLTGDKALDSACLLESFTRDPLRNPLRQITSNWSHTFFSLFAFFTKKRPVKKESKSVIHSRKYVLWRLDFFHSKFVIHPQLNYCVWPPRISRYKYFSALVEASTLFRVSFQLEKVSFSTVWGMFQKFLQQKFFQGVIWKLGHGRCFVIRF